MEERYVADGGDGWVRRVCCAEVSQCYRLCVGLPNIEYLQMVGSRQAFAAVIEAEPITNAADGLGDPRSV